MNINILITGGLGYIGSFTALALLEKGYKVHIVDNESNSFISTLDRIENLCGKRPSFSPIDIRNSGELDQEFERFRPDVVVHLAAMKSVEESLVKPIDYYDNNIGGLITLLKSVNKHGCDRIVYSSSATVYGSPDVFPITETCALSSENVYGETKIMGERIIESWTRASLTRSAVSLRYFNPIGAHPSLALGEQSRSTPTGIMPSICRAVLEQKRTFEIYGGDYETIDGTPERDFIHVLDLAEAHYAAIQYCFKSSTFEVFNIGTGISVSILQLLSAFENATGQKVRSELVGRRPGDVPASLACIQKATDSLQWKSERGLYEMCSDAWNWTLENYSD